MTSRYTITLIILNDCNIYTCIRGSYMWSWLMFVEFWVAKIERIVGCLLLCLGRLARFGFWPIACDQLSSWLVTAHRWKCCIKITAPTCAQWEQSLSRFCLCGMRALCRRHRRSKAASSLRWCSDVIWSEGRGRVVINDPPSTTLPITLRSH